MTKNEAETPEINEDESSKAIDDKSNANQSDVPEEPAKTESTEIPEPVEDQETNPSDNPESSADDKADEPPAKELTEEEKLKQKIKKMKDKHKRELEAKEKELAAQKEKYMYLQAEMENTRKYWQKQVDAAKSKTRADVISSFMPIIEAFEGANKSKETLLQSQCNDETHRFVDGFDRIHENLVNIFDTMQVKPIDQVNVPFDYNKHEVMMKVINDNIEEDTVVNILQKGYMIKDQVIRPAKVIVSKQTPPPPPPVEETPDVIEVQEEETEAEKAPKDATPEKEE